MKYKAIERHIHHIQQWSLSEHWNRMTYTTTTLGKSVRLKFCKYMMIYDDLLWFCFEMFCPL